MCRWLVRVYTKYPPLNPLIYSHTCARLYKFSWTALLIFGWVKKKTRQKQTLSEWKNVTWRFLCVDLFGVWLPGQFLFSDALYMWYSYSTDAIDSSPGPSYNSRCKVFNMLKYIFEYLNQFFVVISFEFVVFFIIFFFVAYINHFRARFSRDLLETLFNYEACDFYENTLNSLENCEWKKMLMSETDILLPFLRWFSSVSIKS